MQIDVEALRAAVYIMTLGKERDAYNLLELVGVEMMIGRFQDVIRAYEESKDNEDES